MPEESGSATPHSKPITRASEGSNLLRDMNFKYKSRSQKSELPGHDFHAEAGPFYAPFAALASDSGGLK